HGGRHAHVDHRALHDRGDGRHRRRHGGRDVPADVQAHHRRGGRSLMKLVEAAPESTVVVGGGGGHDRSSGLLTLIRARLLVATLALPIGILFRPEASPMSWWVLCWSLLAVGA